MILSDLMLFLAITVNCVIWTALKEGEIIVQETLKKSARPVAAAVQLVLNEQR